MVSDTELRELIARAQKLGAIIETTEKEDTEGRWLIESVAVVNVSGIGPNPMPPILAAERLREFLSVTTEKIQFPDPRPGYYYVCAIRSDGEKTLLRGPFLNDHAAALRAVEENKQRAIALEPDLAAEFQYGTVRHEKHVGPGIFDKLDVPAELLTEATHYSGEDIRTQRLLNAAEELARQARRMINALDQTEENIARAYAAQKLSGELIEFANGMAEQTKLAKVYELVVERKYLRMTIQELKDLRSSNKELDKALNSRLTRVCGELSSLGHSDPQL